MTSLSATTRTALDRSASPDRADSRGRTAFSSDASGFFDLALNGSFNGSFDGGWPHYFMATANAAANTWKPCAKVVSIMHVKRGGRTRPSDN